MRDHKTSRLILCSSIRPVIQLAAVNMRPPTTSTTIDHAIQISKVLRHINHLWSLDYRPLPPLARYVITDEYPTLVPTGGVQFSARDSHLTNLRFAATPRVCVSYSAL